MSMELDFADGRRRLRFRLRPLLVPIADDGLFARDSVIRRVYSDPVVMVGAGTALLLQLAHPAVARGVHEHSDYENQPLDRLVGTFYATSSVVFGSRADAAFIGEAIGRVHARVSGPGYSAQDPALVCWVNATLLATAVQCFERLIRPLSDAERDAFTRDSRLVGEVFGCPVDDQPASWVEFQGYWREMLERLEVGHTARRVARSLLYGRGLPARPAWLPALAVARAFTAEGLPPRLREAYGLSWGTLHRATARTGLGAARLLLPRVPDAVRELGPQLIRSPRRAEREVA